jgi:hypothetical protein
MRWKNDPEGLAPWLIQVEISGKKAKLRNLEGYLVWTRFEPRTSPKWKCTLFSVQKYIRLENKQLFVIQSNPVSFVVVRPADVPTAYRPALCTESESSVEFKVATVDNSQGTIRRMEELTERREDNPVKPTVTRITAFWELCVQLPHG